MMTMPEMNQRAKTLHSSTPSPVNQVKPAFGVPHGVPCLLKPVWSVRPACVGRPGRPAAAHIGGVDPVCGVAQAGRQRMVAGRSFQATARSSSV